ncbi:MAG TPA: TIGR01777 family oxidoreductase [Candidatus Dormibacteraeota bacterium]|nr:TIGR01777 family oxidoreductase [Candidatus Dormibacteraeota bacterium]
MRIVIAGGTGLIGRALVGALVDDGHDAVVLTRRPAGADAASLPAGASAAVWDPASPAGSWTSALVGADALVNLAGTNVGTRPWTPSRRREIMDSRMRATSTLVAAMAALPAGDRPRAFVCASGVDYYGDRGDEELVEASSPGDPAASFLAAVCERWEAAAAEAESAGVRVVRMRTGLVLARSALALRLLALPFRLFAGGRTGSGRQWVSWVHMDDVVGLYARAAADPALNGAVNLVAPSPVRNAELAAAIGRTLRRPTWLPQPAPLLRLAMRGQSELLLASRRVLPRAALAAGYDFTRPELEPALAEALGRAAG